MKKAACILIALMMTFALAATALAADVSASYSDGTLTVSTSTSGYWIIVVDGKGTERSLSPDKTTLSFSYPLQDGEHRVRISNDVHGGASIVITIKNGSSVAGSTKTDAPTVQPTAMPKPTAAPVVTEAPNPSAVTDQPAPAVTEQAHKHTPVSMPATEPTCVNDGLTQGVKCSECGQILREQKTIPALGHRYRVESSNNSTVVYRCMRCDKKLSMSPKDALANRYGNIITDLDGAVLTYKAAAAKNDGKTIVFTLDKAADAAVLTLENNLIVQIIREGYDRVEIKKGDFDAVVELNKISRSWFSVDEAINAYIFTLVKEGDCMVEAKTANSIVLAQTFEGVTVK